MKTFFTTLLGALFATSVMAQSLPSPTFNNVQVNGTATVTSAPYFNKSNRAASTEWVTNNSQAINPRFYGATCGLSYDDAALAAAVAAANTTGVPIIITCQLKLANDTTIPNNMIFDRGGLLTPQSGKVLTLQGKVTARVDQWLFNFYDGGRVNVADARAELWSACWFQACYTTDAAPPLRHMFNSGMGNKKIFFPGGNYPICSTILPGTTAYTPVGNGSGQVGYAATNASNVIIKQVSGFKVDATLATFTTCAGSAQNIAFLFDRSTDFEWKGGSFIGNRSGLAAETVNAPFQFMNNERFKVSGARAVSGYFDNGAFFEGTFNRDFVIEDNIGVVGQGVDMAFSVNAVYRNNQFTGASSSSANVGYKCFSQIYDGPSIGGNTIGVGNSENVQVVGNKCDNYQTGIVLQNGKHYRINDNYLLNIKGGTGNPAAAILINYVPSGSFSTVGRPVWNVSISGNHIDGLGATVDGCGVSFGANAIANGDALNRFSINGNMFSGSSGSYAVCADTNSPSKIANLFVGSNEWSNIGAFFNANASSVRKTNP